jgi:hypothetical protein
VAKNLLDEHAQLNIYDPKVKETQIRQDLANVIDGKIGKYKYGILRKYTNFDNDNL